jgi:hypothetical protein
MATRKAAQSTPALRKTRRAPRNSLIQRWHDTARRLLPRRRLSVRVRVLLAFRKIGKESVDAKTAYERTKDFYRATGHPWTRGLG